MATVKVQPILEKRNLRYPKQGDIVCFNVKGLSFSIGIVNEKIAGGLFEITIGDTHQVAVVRLDQMICLSNLTSIEELLTVLGDHV
jgi:hypothetical protein